jgi:hypothetical protein
MFVDYKNIYRNRLSKQFLEKKLNSCQIVVDMYSEHKKT